MPLDDILTDSKPFGPTDHTKINILEDAIDLLELNDPVKSALSGQHLLIYGRKGCGKSSVISIFSNLSYAGEQFDFFDNITIPDKHFKIKIDSWTQFLDINAYVYRQVIDRFGVDDFNFKNHDLIPPEIIEEVWIDQLWDQIFKALRDKCFDDEKLSSKIPNVLLCFDDEKMARMRGTAEYVSTKIFRAAKNDVIQLLSEQDTKMYILIDSMERYPITDSTFSMTMGGFLRAIQTFQQRYQRLSIVFTLPEELMQHFQAASSNILKDFESAYAMRWDAAGLFRMAAHRYSLFFKIKDPHYFDENKKNFDFRIKKNVGRFFEKILPANVRNEMGELEDTKKYIIRHTFLLPRHLILCLNEIARIHHKSSMIGYNHELQFSPEIIVEGIKNSEQEIALEVIQPYEWIYKDLTAELNKIFGELPPIFTFGKLNKCLLRLPRDQIKSSDEALQLLFKIGIIGRIRNKESSQSKVGYVDADFFFNVDGNISFSGSDELCFHPIYSRYFNCNRNRNGDKRIINPYGISTRIN